MKNFLIILFITLSVNLFSDNSKASLYLYSLADSIIEFGDFSGLKISSLDSNSGVFTYIKKGEYLETSRTLFSGNSYYFLAAGNNDIIDIDIMIYDENMNLLLEDNDDKPDSTIEFTPEWTGLYYIKVVLAQCAENIPGSTIGNLTLYSELE